MSCLRHCDVRFGTSRRSGGQPLNSMQNGSLMLFAFSELARILNLFIARRQELPTEPWHLLTSALDRRQQ
ncbi:hypothetical protein NXC14_PA00525 (plasmid) [Rhizobium sp. NXC14]|nr:hypothetical protein NXC14_PA00525 [Rhizobium sp. NXC14]